MIYLILAIICSSSLALILKQGNVKKSNTAILINANYLTASVLSLAFVFYKGTLTISITAFLFALFLGYLFAATFFIYSKAVGLAGTALATVSARLSVLIPVLFSIILYGESLNIKMIICFLFASFAISGIPPFNGFFSKWMIYQGLVEGYKGGDQSWILWIFMAMIGSGLTLASFMKIIHSTILGSPQSCKQPHIIK